MKPTKSLNSRRAFSRLLLWVWVRLARASVGLGERGGVGWRRPARKADAKQPTSRLRSGIRAKQRFAAGQPISWQSGIVRPPPADSIQLVPANKFQDILGFGGCFSDAACYVINQLHPPFREQLLHEMFHPSEMGLNVNRTCIGSADSAAKLYSYDDGDAIRN